MRYEDKNSLGPPPSIHPLVEIIMLPRASTIGRKANLREGTPHHRFNYPSVQLMKDRLNNPMLAGELAELLPDQRGEQKTRAPTPSSLTPGGEDGEAYGGMNQLPTIHFDD